MSIYLELTERFNRGRIRAVLSSGQAVVLYRVTIMSKDGDWIIREDEESCLFILRTLEEFGARYRFGAPLDVRWLSHGWSSHFEFSHDGIRVRTDFVSRPPRVSDSGLRRIWDTVGTPPITPLPELIQLKLTQREKDYPVVGELARKISDPYEQLLYSRSAGDILRLAATNPNDVTKAAVTRPLLLSIGEGRETLEDLLDKERRELIRADRHRMKRFQDAAAPYTDEWPRIAEELRSLSLHDAHSVLTRYAERLLPYAP
jgi:hypothetical protein